jgi:hypothetical protein
MRFFTRLSCLWWLLTDPEARAILNRTVDAMVEERTRRWRARLDAKLDAKIKELEELRS